VIDHCLTEASRIWTGCWLPHDPSRARPTPGTTAPDGDVVASWVRDRHMADRAPAGDTVTRMSLMQATTSAVTNCRVMALGGSPAQLSAGGVVPDHGRRNALGEQFEPLEDGGQVRLQTTTCRRWPKVASANHDVVSARASRQEDADRVGSVGQAMPISRRLTRGRRPPSARRSRPAPPARASPTG
jgi:hypothetical protein